MKNKVLFAGSNAGVDELTCLQNLDNIICKNNGSLKFYIVLILGTCTVQNIKELRRNLKYFIR